MVSVVVRSALVADRVRGRINAGEHTIDGYHVDTKYDPPHLDSYYIGDEVNGVAVLCEPAPGYGQRICAVSYCRYEQAGILVEGRFEFN